MENKLEFLEKFKTILENYHISEDSKHTLSDTRLVLLLAPSGGGRNTLIRELIKSGEYHFIVSDTTRHPRSNDGVLEKDGVEYWFRSEQDVLSDLEYGKYLEAELIHDQQVSGISIRELQKAIQENKIAITDVDMGGLHNIVSAKPDVKAILILPPSFEIWQNRMLNRGTMTSLEHRRRLETAVRVFTIALEHDYFSFVINDQIKNASGQIHAIANGIQDINQVEARGLAEKLRIDTIEFLNSN